MTDEADQSSIIHHDDADTLSFVGDSSTGTVTIWYFDLEEGEPVEKVAEYDVNHFQMVLEQACAAKLDAEGGLDVTGLMGPHGGGD